jgi:hypothetical protein
MTVSLHQNKLLLWSKLKARMCSNSTSMNYRQSLFNSTPKQCCLALTITNISDQWYWWTLSGPRLLIFAQVF